MKMFLLLFGLWMLFLCCVEGVEPRNQNNNRRLTIRNQLVVKEIPLVNEGEDETSSTAADRERVLQDQTEKKLWMIHPNHTSPSAIVVFVAKGYYLVYDTYANMRTTWEPDEILEWKKEYKYDTLTTMSFPVVVHTVPEMTSHFPHSVHKIGKNTFIVREKQNLTSSNEESHENITIPGLAAIPYVMWIDEFLPLNMYSKTARTAHYSSELSPPSVCTGGDGIIVAIADTGIDPSHCAFYDPEVGTPITGQIIPGPHSKISSMMTSVPGLTDYAGIDGAHGSATAGAFGGFNCGSNVGMATCARIAFYDFSPPGTDEVIYLPTDETAGVMTYYDYLELVLTIGQATIVSGSWGVQNRGLYDAMCSMTDEIAWNFQRTAFVFAAGNSGDTNAPLPSSPSTAKNVISVGASFSGVANYVSMFANAIKNAAYYAVSCIVSFSSHGPLPDGRMNPLVYSPGVYEIVPYGYYSPIAGHNQYFRLSGTSFSTPNIAGFIAEYQSSFKSRNEGLVPLGGLVKAMLIAISLPMAFTIMAITSQTGAFPYRQAELNEMGFGVPTGEYNEATDQEIEGTLESGQIQGYCFPYQFDPLVWNQSCNSQNNNNNNNICVDASMGGNGVTIGIAWHDVNAVPYVSHPLINDLDALVFMNYQLVGVLNNAVDPHEQIAIQNDGKSSSSSFWALDGSSILRVVVYEKDHFIEGGTGVQPFGMFLRTSPFLPGISFGTGYACGVCSGVEKQLCPVTPSPSSSSSSSNESTSFSPSASPLPSPVSSILSYQYCNVTDGEWTACLPVSDPNQTMVCGTDFYYDQGVCKCVLGYITSSSNKVCGFVTTSTSTSYDYVDPLFQPRIESEVILVTSGEEDDDSNTEHVLADRFMRFSCFLVLVFFIL
jgi:hypothetical protein